MHYHKCPDCGCVWRHGSECWGREDLHICPNKSCRSAAVWEDGGEHYRTPTADEIKRCLRNERRHNSRMGS